ncbi:HNH endonuclease signature motif containing protein [Latilactobacillus sakei]|nr:HNH endonuclease signature motif containing protein [Latilactobacillus sakei]
MWNRWKRKHRIIWESKNGPIPEGYKLLFVDGNSLNLSLKNMALVTSAEMARLNQGGYIYPDADMTKTMLNVVKIRNKIWQINK